MVCWRTISSISPRGGNDILDIFLQVATNDYASFHLVKCLLRIKFLSENEVKRKGMCVHYILHLYILKLANSLLIVSFDTEVIHVVLKFSACKSNRVLQVLGRTPVANRARRGLHID